MADDAIIASTNQLLPDEIAVTLDGEMSVAPDDASDKWYYKLTSITTTSANLIAGSFLDYTAVDAATAPTAIDAADKIKFLFIKNQSDSDGIYIVLDGGTAAFNVADGIFIGAGQSFYGRFPNTTVGNVNAISADIGDAGDASVTAIVAAIIEDVA